METSFYLERKELFNKHTISSVKKELDTLKRLILGAAPGPGSSIGNHGLSPLHEIGGTIFRAQARIKRTADDKQNGFRSLSAISTQSGTLRLLYLFLAVEVPPFTRLHTASTILFTMAVIPAVSAVAVTRS